MTSPTPPLASLTSLLAEEPALRAVISRQTTVAVPDAARPLFVAALAATTSRRPLLLAVPTGAEAERLVRDLGQFLGLGKRAAIGGAEAGAAFGGAASTSGGAAMRALSQRYALGLWSRTGATRSSCP